LLDDARQFIFVWQDLLVGLLFLQSPDVRPITVGLATIPSLITGLTKGISR
jgi:ABC-type glycerol-3-phosphate transport system permease component